MNFGKDWSQACGVDGVMSLENSHALIAVLFSSMKFVLNFTSRWGLCAVSILIMVCIPQLLVDCCRGCFARSYLAERYNSKNKIYSMF